MILLQLFFPIFLALMLLLGQANPPPQCTMLPVIGDGSDDAPWMPQYPEEIIGNPDKGIPAQRFSATHPMLNPAKGEFTIACFSGKVDIPISAMKISIEDAKMELFLKNDKMDLRVLDRVPNPKTETTLLIERSMRHAWSLIGTAVALAADALDTFTGTDDDYLDVYSADWECGYTGAECPDINNNSARNGIDGTRAIATYTGFVPGANQGVQIEIAVWQGVGTGEIGPLARATAAPDQTYYACKALLNDGSFTTSLQLRTAGALTLLGTENGTSWGVGDINRIEASGTAQTCHYNGGSATIVGGDLSLASGRGGIVITAFGSVDDLLGDNFFLEDLAAPATTVLGRRPVIY